MDGQAAVLSDEQRNCRRARHNACQPKTFELFADYWVFQYHGKVTSASGPCLLVFF